MGFDLIDISAKAAIILMCLLVAINWKRIRRRHNEGMESTMLVAALSGCISPALAMGLFFLVFFAVDYLAFLSGPRDVIRGPALEYDSLAAAIISGLLVTVLTSLAFYFVVLARTALDLKSRRWLTGILALLLINLQAALLMLWSSPAPALRWLIRSAPEHSKQTPYDD